MAKQKIVKKIKFEKLQKLSAAVSLFAFLIIIVSGVMAEVRCMTIIFRSLGVILVIGLFTRVLIQILANYEEVNSGK